MKTNEQSNLEAPELMLIGAADEVILGAISGIGDDHIGFSSSDFEFEQD